MGARNLLNIYITFYQCRPQFSPFTDEIGLPGGKLNYEIHREIKTVLRLKWFGHVEMLMRLWLIVELKTNVLIQNLYFVNVHFILSAKARPQCSLASSTRLYGTVVVFVLVR